MSKRAEVYRRLNEQASKKVASWPQSKRDSIISYPRPGSKTGRLDEPSEASERVSPSDGARSSQE